MEEFESEEYLVPVIPDDPLLQIDWEEEEEEKRMKNGEIQILKKGIRYMYHTARNFGESKIFVNW